MNKHIWMLLDFRGNLRGPSGNRPDTKFMSIFCINFSVDGICTASVTTRDPGNDTKTIQIKFGFWLN